MSEIQSDKALAELERLIILCLSDLTAVPGFQRNGTKPDDVPAGGKIVMRDGDPGEPEIDLGGPDGPIYNYAHSVPLEIGVRDEDPDAVLTAIKMRIGAMIVANRIRAGYWEYLDAEAPAQGALEIRGARSGKWAELLIVVEYSTTNPLG